MNKQCSKCQKVKNSAEFYKGRGYCKECGREMCRNYKARNKEKMSAYNKIYKKDNREQISFYNKEYNIKNRKQMQKRHTKYLLNRKKTNPEYKMALMLRNRVRGLLKGISTKKNKSTMELLGCNYEIFVKWLQYQFRDNMDMKNHGKMWHIDHVIPCKQFSLIDPKEQEKCFHWANMQPLISIENLRKGSKADINEINRHLEKAKNFLLEYKEEVNEEMKILDYDRTKYL